MKIDFYEDIRWIFSGIGVLVIGLAINFWRNRRKSRRKVDDLKNVSSVAPFEKRDVIKNVSYFDSVANPKYSAISIMEELANLPPYQIDLMKTAYYGIRIKWNVEYITIHKIDNFWQIMCHFEGNYPWVIFEIDLNKYPIFKTIKKGTRFNIVGEIKKIAGNEFFIDLESI